MSPAPPRSVAKVWLFRALTACVFPAIFLLLLEGGLRLSGTGRPTDFVIPDDKPGYVRTNPDYLNRFLPESFALRPLNYRIAAQKPANTVRIVVLGESAAQGVPVPAFSFAPQLRAQLRAQYPDKNIEVINTGVVAINSHVVYQIAKDLAQYTPDLFVVYMGNNEVVGPYGPGSAYLSTMRPVWAIRLGVWVSTTYSGQLVARGIKKLSGFKKEPLEWGGMAMFVDNAVRGDDLRLQTVYRNFETNLRDIIKVANGAGAKTLLCTVVSNLKDSPPFLSLHRADLSDEDLATWQSHFNQGKLAWKLGEQEIARIHLQEAWRLDPQYADTAFMLGDLEQQAGGISEARKWFLQAQRWDALRFRPDPRINEIIREVAAGQPTVRLVDAARVMGADPSSTVRPAGRELFLEHVHFNWEGNHQLARLMAVGAEVALFGDNAALSPWLDSAGCAAVLGYTPQGKLRLLQKTAGIVRNPPFTNQLTYGEDQSQLAREIGRSATAARDPQLLRQAREVVRAAIAGDPESADLALIAEGIELDLGDAAAALAFVRQAAQLLPTQPTLFADEASLLAQLGRLEEAEEVLQRGARLTGEQDQLAPSFAALYTLMNRHAEGRAYLDRAIERNPADNKLRLRRGILAKKAGENAAAEKEFCAMLSADPGDQNALEELVSLLSEQGQTAVIEMECLAVAEQQLRNQQNNLRVAKIHEARGDEVQAVRFLVAAQNSGPGIAAAELRIARTLYHLQRREEMLLHLAQALRLTVIEEDPESTEEIRRLIARTRLEKN